MIIDMFPHILPAKYRNAISKYVPSDDPSIEPVPSLVDIETRLSFMDKYGSDYVQILCLKPFAEEIAKEPKETAELARIGNDAVAEILDKYPKRFIAGTAILPMNDVEAALKEMDRAIKGLGLKGIQICSHVDSKTLDSAEFMPIYEKASDYDVPIWVHPSSFMQRTRPTTSADYSPDVSNYINAAIGWPHEIMVAIIRLVCCGLLEKHPNLKIYTHLTAGGLAYYSERIADLLGVYKRVVPNSSLEKLSKAPIEYLRMFYADTEMGYSTAAFECTYAFLGAEHVVFSSGMPFGRQYGHSPIGESISAIKRMHISDSDKQKIFEGNARKLLHLG